MAMTQQLHNYLATLQISPVSCVGFEEEALGACVGLVGWGFPSKELGREAWYRAVATGSSNATGTLQAGPENKSFFYTALSHRQRAAFVMFGFSDIDWARFNIADFPWALPDALFDSLYPQVESDRGPTYERPPTWNDVKALGDTLGFSSPLAPLGKQFFKAFLTRYVPTLAESAVLDWAAPVALGGLWAGVKFENWAARVHNAQTRDAFRVDKERRDYDRAVVPALAETR